MKKFLIKIYLSYLRILMKLQLLKNRPLIIGVSGSAGKSTTVDAIASILKDYKKIKYTHDMNSETGIPFDTLGVYIDSFRVIDWIIVSFKAFIKLLTNWEKYEIYIVEMGVDSIDYPKNMKYLLRLLKPKIAVYLNVNAVHAQFYEHKLSNKTYIGKENSEKILKEVKDLIAEDKNLLIKQIPTDGLAVLNMDDTRVANSKILCKGTTYEIQNSYLAVKQARFLPSRQAGKIQDSKKGGANSYRYYSLSNDGGFNFKFYNKKEYQVQLKNFVLPDHMAISILSAIAVAKFIGISIEDSIISLEKNFNLKPGRSSLFEGIENSLIIDSSYNSSKEPCQDMLQLLSTYQDYYKIAVLGDMREMGLSEAFEHEDLARFAKDKADEFVLIGSNMQKYFLPKLLDLGFNKSKVKWFSKAGEAAKFLESKLQFLNQSLKNSVILVKGSQNTLYLDIVVEKLLKNKDDSSKLCRRGEYWDLKRQQYT